MKSKVFIVNNNANFRFTETQLREKIYSEICRCESEFNIELKLRFIWTPTSFIGMFGDNMTLSVNLNAFNFSDCVLKNEVDFFYSYFIQYVVEYIVLIVYALKHKPSDYLEGLAAANSFLQLNECGKIRMCIPLMSRRLKEKKCRYMSPTDLYCSITAFDKTLNFTDSNLISSELKRQNSLLCVWRKVPEIYYSGSRIPLYSSTESLRNLIKFNSSQDRSISETVFYGRYIDKVCSMTVAELIEDGVLNGNPMSTGLAVRLFSFMKSCDVEKILCKENLRNNLEKAIAEFCIAASDYLKACNGSSSKFLKDNSVAVSKMIKNINYISLKYGLNIKNGNVHPIFP